MRVRSKISVPLKFATEVIKTKMGTNTTIPFLWKNLNNNYLVNPLSFNYEDFELKRYFTIDKEDQKKEKMFFGGSMIGTYYLAKINHELFDINKTLNINKVVNQ